jgi:hypothetical protein
MDYPENSFSFSLTLNGDFIYMDYTRETKKVGVENSPEDLQIIKIQSILYQGVLHPFLYIMNMGARMTVKSEEAVKSLLWFGVVNLKMAGLILTTSPKSVFGRMWILHQKQKLRS